MSTLLNAFSVCPSLTVRASVRPELVEGQLTRPCFDKLSMNGMGGMRILPFDKLSMNGMGGMSAMGEREEKSN